MKSLFKLFGSVWLIASINLFIACTKKKEEPAPVVQTPAPTPPVTPKPDTTAATPNTFSDGTYTTTATIKSGIKDASTGHITVSLIKAATEFPTVFLSIDNPTSTGTFKDDDSPNTYGQLKYSPSDSYTSDKLRGGTCVITVTTLTSTQIAGSFRFTGKKSGASDKVITGAFDCPYTVK